MPRDPIMKPEDRAYILKNAGKMSPAGIARHLGLKERTVRRFLEGRETSKPAPSLHPGVRPRGLWVAILLIVVLGASVYANSLQGDYIWDDEHLVKNNAYIRDPGNLAGIFTKKEIRKEYGFYRPIQEASYMADYALWRGNVMGYHLTNTLLHILAALAVFWILNLLFGRMLLSLVAAGLFVVHPVHTEAVAYISGRADTLAGLFLLLAFVSYIKQTGPPSTEASGGVIHPPEGQDGPSPFLLGVMLLSYAAAILSKEISLIFPVLLIFYHAVFRKGRGGAPLFAVLGATGLYVLVRLTLLRHFMAVVEAETTLLQRLPGFFVALTEYIRILLLPFSLHMEYGQGLSSWSNPQTTSGVILFAVLLLAAIKKHRTAPLITFSIGWFFLTLLPQANLFPVNAFMSEHWLYLPSIGFFILIAAGVDHFYRERNARVILVIPAAAALFFSVLTIRQNIYWSDPIIFYRKTLAYAPESTRLLNDLGILTYKEGDADEATALLQRAISLKPDYAEAYNNIGSIHREAGRLDEAAAYFTKAIEIDPTYAEALNNMAIVAFLKGDPQRAIPLFKRAITLQPDFAQAHYNLATALFQMKETGLAEHYLDKARSLGLSSTTH